MSDWVDVNERLPEYSGDYICTRARYPDSEVVAFIVADSDEPARWFDSQSAHSVAYNFSQMSAEQRDRAKTFGKVTHWMPMPEPFTQK